MSVLQMYRYRKTYMNKMVFTGYVTVKLSNSKRLNLILLNHTFLAIAYDCICE